MSRCPSFGSCGGCSAQHIPYEVQLENKKRLIEAAAGIEPEVFSAEPYGYRNRMDFVFSQNGPSLRKKGRWDRLIPIEGCAISNKKLNALLKEVQEWFDSADTDVFDMRKKTGTLRYSVIRTPEFSDDSSISFVLNSDSTTIGKNVDAIKEFAKHSSAKSVVITYAHKDTDISTSSDFFVVKGSDMITERIAGHTYSYSVQGFMQNNSVMAAKMVEYCRTILKNKEDAFLLDLYGGVGLFGIALSKQFSEVFVVESLQQSIDAAKNNAEQNNVKNLKAECIDARSLRKLDIAKRAGNRPLIVLTDPPRCGMHHKTINYLIELAPERIIYVSCNPKQLSKELNILKKAYTVSSAAVFDLFPQTNHVETIVMLTKAKIY